LFSGRLLNIFSIRSVIRKPLTMFVTAAVMAMKPSTLLSVVASREPVITIAPTTEIAEIALVSDISGVCNRGDTLRITSNPTKVASMNTKSPTSRLDIERSQTFPYARMHDLTIPRDQRFAHDLVVEIQRELAVL